MKAKRAVSIVLAIILTLSLFGCGASDEAVPTNDQTSTVSESANPQQTTPSTETSKPEANEPVPPVDVEENTTQKNSIAMLNYIIVITEKIKQSSNSKLYLEEVGNGMLSDFNPNAIDNTTQTYISDLYRLVNNMRMIDIKRERLAFIYDQNKAQAIMSAAPSPMSILNVVQSRSPLKAIASVVYVAVDSAKSYESATYANEMQYLQDGWELDDNMDAQLTDLNIHAFNYCQNIVNDNGIDGNLTLSQNMAKVLVEWENNDNVSRRIAFLTNHQEEYKACGHYWLLLSRSYYENGNYVGCVEAMDKYIEVQPSLFRRDVDMAKLLPLVIASLADKYSGDELIEKELFYVQLLSNNVESNDWASRYYAALTYMDLYAKTNNRDYLQKAFNEAKTNVNEVKRKVKNIEDSPNLIDAQFSSNRKYLADVEEATASKTATRDEKKEVKKYNKMLKEVRKTELAPIDNALLINVKLMLDLAHELNLPQSQLKELDDLIHGNNSQLFLVDSIDAELWASKNVKLDAPDIVFDGDEITIPANYVCAQSAVTVSINGKKIETGSNWTVDSVKRKGTSPSEFVVTYVNKDFKDVKCRDGDIVTVTINPYEDYFEPIEVSFKTVVSKTLFITTYSFEKI